MSEGNHNFRNISLEGLLHNKFRRGFSRAIKEDQIKYQSLSKKIKYLKNTL